MLVCVGASVCVCVCVCVSLSVCLCVCVYALRIVSWDKILRFKNTFIIIINIINQLVSESVINLSLGQR